MPLSWNDDEAWILRTDKPTHGCAPPYVSNARLGLRLGALILGTDRHAPPLISARAEVCRPGTPQFDHSYPLQAFAAHARDDCQYCLPSWANIDLQVGEQRFDPAQLYTSSNQPLNTWLDLRTGEAGLDGIWRCDGVPVTVRIRLLLPRGSIPGAFWQLELEGLERPTEIVFGLKGTHLLDDLPQTYHLVNGRILGLAHTPRRQRTIGFGLGWEAEGADKIEPDLGTPGAALVRLRTSGKTLSLGVFHTVRGGMESWNDQELQDDLIALSRGAKDGSLREGNAGVWRKLWTDALDVTALPLDARDQKFLLAQQFYLLASYDGSAYPTAPLGLSGNQWAGAMLWDTDLWHFRALNILWPELARQPVKARLAMLPEARRYAASLGLKGAWFGWMCDDQGVELSPPHYTIEIHINAWIALAAWESAARTKDRAWLEEVFPLLAEIADAVCARAERSADGAYHLNHVLPPDESVVEDARNSGSCNDNVATNLAFRTALRAALAAAKDLERPAPDLWSEVADGLTILAPGADGVIPEYVGYNGHSIKQADLILCFYPLNLEVPVPIIRANLDYYRTKVTWGPLMNDQVDACIRLRHGFGEREAVLQELIQRYRRYVRGPFEVPYECVDISNSIMLTACGGLLQALVYGWFGVNDPGDTGMVPRLGGSGL